MNLCSNVRVESNPTKNIEPVSKFTIHIEKGLLAFEKAVAQLLVNGKPLTNLIYTI
jgi:hypothetical protein